MYTIEDGLREEGERMLYFADRLCHALGDFIQVAVAVKDPRSPAIFMQACWVGLVPPGTVSRAPWVVLEKLAELLRCEAVPTDLVLTPIAGDKHSLGWMGGATKAWTYAAANKWAQEWDALLALLMLYNAVEKPLRLHHAGFRFPTVEAFHAARDACGDVTLFERPADDHKRIYIPMVLRGGARCYRELQFFPEGPQDHARHWDFVTERPREFLQWISGAYGTKPIFWEHGPTNPWGMVKVQDKEGNQLNVMARDQWWKVESN